MTSLMLFALNSIAINLSRPTMRKGGLEENNISLLSKTVEVIAHQKWCACILPQSILALIFGKGKLAIFESTNISETREATPTKIDVHAFDINPYLHIFFELIPID